MADPFVYQGLGTCTGTDRVVCHSRQNHTVLRSMNCQDGDVQGAQHWLIGRGSSAHGRSYRRRYHEVVGQHQVLVRRRQCRGHSRHPALTVGLYVSFGLHTFTRSVERHDEDHQLYRDNRELRTFCPTRYGQSFALPNIVRTLERRRCEFAQGVNSQINYVTVETADGERYAAFFDLRRFKKLGPTAVHLMVQSAYVLDPGKPTPGNGRIHFHALLGHAIRGTIPRRPP